jgi:hypothetical protein
VRYPANKLEFFINNDSDALRIELAGSLSAADVESVRETAVRQDGDKDGDTQVACRKENSNVQSPS